MSTRMSKYYDEAVEKENINSRFRRNNELYKEIYKNDITNYDIKSNATVLGDNHNEIDVEKIKKILDSKYNEQPRRKSIRLEIEEDDNEEREITKEYDINVILEKAREEKVDNYQEERLKKLRDTQFDILNNLNLEKQKDNIDAEDNLKELINTIAINESKNTSVELDILSDLKGDDDTELLEGLKEEINNREEEDIDINDTKLINSFYTSSNNLKVKDFEDMEDFSKEIEGNNVFVKVMIGLIIVVFVIGIALLIKTLYFS